MRIGCFIGILRPGQKGLFVSFGGFSKEARYEAERSIIEASVKSRALSTGFLLVTLVKYIKLILH